MPVKKYGIYLIYSPTVDLRAQGLSRYLVEFLRAAQERKDIRFVIVCPSWIYPKLLELFKEFGIQLGHFDILSPRRKPWILRTYERLVIPKKRPKKKRHLRLLLQRLFQRCLSLLTVPLAKWFVSARSTFSLIVFAVVMLSLVPLGGIALPIILLLQVVLTFGRKVQALMRRLLHKPYGYLKTLIFHPKRNVLITELYRLMTEAEASLMLKLIETQNDIAAWYCPTAFWPQFNQIAAPRLMCVPDVILTQFPIGFSLIGDDQMLYSFRQIEQSIRNCDYFVTYSEATKWQTLVDRYQINPDAIQVIAHGSNFLSNLVTISGFPDNKAATEAHCRNLFRLALLKATDSTYATVYLRSRFRFLFYASQFRPNKNILSLLRSYEYLLRRRYIQQKLILTGDPHNSEITNFITQHSLQADVLCLHSLTDQELAACYWLTDLAVNPSLSEGGCPFTFTEALSVDTPVVMARIPVTKEIIIDPTLQKVMLFDPYDWQDMANRIEWALANQEKLLSMQKLFYCQLAQRTWRTVVDEHVALLEKMVDRASNLDADP